MEFIRENVLDCFDLEKAVIGSKGYFSDSLFVLKQIVQEDERKEGGYSTLWKVQKDSRFPFYTKLGEFNCSFFYPVEMPEEPKYRPFKDVQELKTFFCEKYYEEELGASNPFIWIKNKDSKAEFLIITFLPFTVHTDMESLNLTELFNLYTFLDGSQCGVAE